MTRIPRRGSGPGVALGVLLVASPALGLAASPSPLHATIIGRDFDKVVHVDAIPAPIAAALAPLVGGKALVDPVSLDKAANAWKPNPGDRLLFAAASSGLYLVQYELHAPAPTAHLAVFHYKGHDKARLLEHLILDEQAASIPALKNMIQAGQYKVVSSAPADAGGHE